MSSNWNIYKIFKNGKRAKAPLHSFSFDGTEDEMQNYFSSYEINVLSEKVGEKFGDLKYKILNSNVSQKHVMTKQEIFEKNKNKILGKLISDSDLSTERKYTGGLVYCSESEWKWQWAALQVATNNYIRGLSPNFDTYEDALSWMETKIAVLYSLK